MNDNVRNYLIKTIQEKIPAGTSMAVYLSDTLNIGRESVYRRIRGEINFTFDEIAILSLRLGFSVDNLIGLKQSDNALFNIHMLQNSDYFDIYVNKMKEYGSLFREMHDLPNTKALASVNTLPYFLHIKYENFSRFRIYKWLYQNQKINSNDKFADFALPEKVLKTHEEFYQDVQRIPNITIIMDDNIFWSAAKEIKYFLQRGLLSKDDVMALRDELYDMLETIEQIAAEGVNKSGVKVLLYVCAVDLEASYMHIEYGDSQFAQVRIFSISAIDSYNEGLCKIQKEWIESLKKFSVLISESGEMQRFEYLNKQYEYIDRILEIKQL